MHRYTNFDMYFDQVSRCELTPTSTYVLSLYKKVIINDYRLSKVLLSKSKTIRAYGGVGAAVETVWHEWNAPCHLEATRILLEKAGLVALSVQFSAATIRVYPYDYCIHLYILSAFKN